MTLHYSHEGAGSPVVLLHGLFGDSGNLGVVARELAEHFSVYSLDLPNHGLSERSEYMSYRAQAAGVARTIDTLDLAPCHILGHSMGGKVAMQLALDRPELLQKLVVADIAPVQYPNHHNDVLAGLAEVSKASPTGRREAEAMLAQHVSEAGVRAFLLKSWKKQSDGSWHWQFNHQVIEDQYHQISAAPKPLKPGNQFDGEVLFIAGGNSTYIKPEHQAATLTLFPNATMKVIPGTGHWLHAEKPAAFNRLVLRFLQNH